MCLISNKCKILDLAGYSKVSPSNLFRKSLELSNPPPSLPSTLHSCVTSLLQIKSLKLEKYIFVESIKSIFLNIEKITKICLRLV